MEYFSRAADATSMLSCCISSSMSTFLMMAFGPTPPFSLGEEPVSVEVAGAASVMTVEGEKEG